MMPRLAQGLSVLTLALAPTVWASDLLAVDESTTASYARDLSDQPSHVFPYQPANTLLAAAPGLGLSLDAREPEAEPMTALAPGDFQPSALAAEPSLDIEWFGAQQPVALAALLPERGQDVQTA